MIVGTDYNLGLGYGCGTKEEVLFVKANRRLGTKLDIENTRKK